MTIPAAAPSTPDSQEPFVEVILPFFTVDVASPKYQTVPCLSWANQSSVASESFPSSYKLSFTTTQCTPWITLLCRVTLTTSRVRLPSEMPVKTYVVPGRSGYHGLSIVRTKLAG